MGECFAFLLRFFCVHAFTFTQGWNTA
jgi:hypothetical protein